MKLHEFVLLEYKRDITKQKLGDKLLSAAKKNERREVSLDWILEVLEKTDPTKNKQYVQWLANQYIKGSFRVEDFARIHDALVYYKGIQQRLPIEQRDLNRLSLHQMEEIVDKAMTPELDNSDDNFDIPDVKVLYNGPLGTLAIPETKEASCKLGRGTKWCTAARENNAFDTYSEQTPLYIWKDKNGKKYQFHFPSTQFMDDKDKPIDHDLLTYFRTKHPVLSKLFKKGEEEILHNNTAYELYRYARDVIEGRWPEAEPYIMKDPFEAKDYACDVIKGRWPEAEPYIMEDPHTAYRYARDVIKGIWPEAEPYIMEDPASWRRYKKCFGMK